MVSFNIKNIIKKKNSLQCSHYYILLVKFLTLKYVRNKMDGILKFQNELLIDIFVDFMKRKKLIREWNRLNFDQREDWIKLRLQKDLTMKQFFLGLIIGHFTNSELEIYLFHNKTINKRIQSMLSQRLASQIENL